MDDLQKNFKNLIREISALHNKCCELVSLEIKGLQDDPSFDVALKEYKNLATHVQDVFDSTSYDEAQCNGLITAIYNMISGKTNNSKYDENVESVLIRALGMLQKRLESIANISAKAKVTMDYADALETEVLLRTLIRLEMLYEEYEVEAYSEMFLDKKYLNMIKFPKLEDILLANKMKLPDKVNDISAEYALMNNVPDDVVLNIKKRSLLDRVKIIISKFLGYSNENFEAYCATDDFFEKSAILEACLLMVSEEFIPDIEKNADNTAKCCLKFDNSLAKDHIFRTINKIKSAQKQNVVKPIDPDKEDN